MRFEIRTADYRVDRNTIDRIVVNDLSGTDVTQALDGGAGNNTVIP